MIINLYVTICDADNVSETNIVRRINACKKKILLALVLLHSTVVDSIFDTSSTVMVMVMQDFLGG